MRLLCPLSYLTSRKRTAYWFVWTAALVVSERIPQSRLHNSAHKRQGVKTLLPFLESCSGQGLHLHGWYYLFQRIKYYNTQLGGLLMFEYMTAQEATECWKISVRRVQQLCKENRIKGVLNINRVWLIPKKQKNIGRRLKTNQKQNGADEIE